MSAIRFILDGDIKTVKIVDATRTVLQYLREDLRRNGTKEGCAEGDCGACTVVIAEAEGNKLRYRAVNACIQFLPTLDGKALFTVESLNQSNGQLHPVQQSMVDYHASQCGFCTPGFVMSLYAQYQNGGKPDRSRLDDVLSGNLCRCTGYKPIIEAGEHMFDYEQVNHDETKLLNQLRAIQTTQISTESYAAPRELVTLAEHYQQYPDATLLAGGTDVGLWVTKQLRELSNVIYLCNIDALKQIKLDDEYIEIGAAVSLEDAFNGLLNDYPELSELFRRFASMPVRNAGTLVGNIANGSPIGDSMPALICIDARVKLRLGTNTRELDLQDLYIDYQKNALRAGEFIESVMIPRRDSSIQIQSYKISKRFDQDISAVCAAFALRLDGNKVKDIRIAFGGMAAIPKRAEQTEQSLNAGNWDEQSVRQGMALLNQDYQPLSDMRASSRYRSQAAANLLYRFYLQTCSDAALNVFEIAL